MTKPIKSVLTFPNLSPAAALGSMQRRTLREEIAGKIAALISSRLMQVGDELPGERDLAAALSVSRETIRGALGLLAKQGMIAVTQGARSRVITAEAGALTLATPGRLSVSSYGLDDVHAARMLLELEAVRLAAERIDGGTLALLARLIAAQETMQSDALQFLICDREFHALIYRASGNALLSDLSLDLYGYLADRRRGFIGQPGQIAASISDHRAILAGLTARDPGAAAKAFAAHETRIYDTSRALLDALRTEAAAEQPSTRKDEDLPKA